MDVPCSEKDVDEGIEGLGEEVTTAYAVSAVAVDEDTQVALGIVVPFQDEGPIGIVAHP
jgi:hypothetical protein